jgi:hypothetical protein
LYELKNRGHSDGGAYRIVNQLAKSLFYNSPDYEAIEAPPSKYSFPEMVLATSKQ